MILSLVDVGLLDCWGAARLTKNAEMTKLGSSKYFLLKVLQCWTPAKVQTSQAIQVCANGENLKSEIF